MSGDQQSGGRSTFTVFLLSVVIGAGLTFGAIMAVSVNHMLDAALKAFVGLFA